MYNFKSSIPVFVVPVVVFLLAVPSNESIAAAGIREAMPTVSKAQEEDSMLRNIAKFRAVYHSSSANFSNTGQLVTDGIISNSVSSPTPTGPVITQQWSDSPESEEEQFAFDGLGATKYLSRHPQAWVQYQFPEGEKYAVAGYAITTANDMANRNPRDWILYGVTDDGRLEIVDSRTDQLSGLPQFTTMTFVTTRNTGKAYKAYRFSVAANNGNTEGNFGGMVQFAELDLRDSGGNSVITKYSAVNEFASYWQSAATGTEWVYIDLGGRSRISSVRLQWGDDNYASSYDIQVSNDTKTWGTVYSTTTGRGGGQDIPLPAAAAGTYRYIRLFAKVCQGTSYMLHEFEVFGMNDVIAMPKPQPPEEPCGMKQFLIGGNWKLQRVSEVEATGEELTSLTVAYDDSDWLAATVPGTVLVSYLNNGAVPDPNYADHSFFISESYFMSDFWYRNSFIIPESKKGRRIFLNFNNINWKADVFFNGKQIGRIEGAFIRGKFDVTDLVYYGVENIMAVYIYKNDTPGAVHGRTIESTGSNGGVLGMDNPTIHASVGWDWVPTIRGRNIGIYGDVFLSYSGAVQLADPWIETHLNAVGGSDAFNAAIDHSTAYLAFRTEVSNSTDNPVTAMISGTIMPGNIRYTKTVTVPANGRADIEINDIVINKPNLWWPNRYGEQFLYTNVTQLMVGGQVSDEKTFNVGIREMRYAARSPFQIYVNGARIYCSGGNWGMDDSMLRNTAEDYDISVRLHKEAGFTMIRNWVGMTGNEGFYNACDKYGILIMDDFWLANPSDGPNPNDEAMFMANAIDKIKWLRKHPALAFYCGRNEGRPPTTLNVQMSAATAAYDGSRYYVPHSAAGQLSGFGPYTAQGPNFYFTNANENFHSERGMPNIPSLESIKKMIPEEQLWPLPNFMWAYHDFTMDGAQNGRQFLSLVRQYGTAQNVEDFVKYAQMVNYENHKAMFEGPQTAQGNAMLMWMSQSAWPSMVWQSYDYYYDTNAGYFGIKKANQIVNAIYNPVNRTITVTNNSGRAYSGLRLELETFDLYGKKINSQVIAALDLAPDQVITNATSSPPVTRAMTTTNTNFIVTRIKDSSGVIISDNFYWMTFAAPRNFSDLQQLDMISLDTSYEINNETGVNFITATITNNKNIPALMIRVKTLTDKTAHQVLPAYYSDNYFSLMPGETKDITIEFDDKYLRGESPVFFVEGFNIRPQEFGAYAAATKAPEQEEFNNLAWSDTYPKAYSDWGEALLAGNGKMGIMVFGNPRSETVIFNDRGFNKAPTASAPARTFNDIPQTTIDQIKNYLLAENWNAANDLANSSTNWQDGGEGNRHPGFKMAIELTGTSGNVSNYRRSVNYATGEIAVNWTDNNGNWERKTFVSRKDNVIVQYLTKPTNGTLNCTIELSIDPGMDIGNFTATRVSSADYLNIRVKYPDTSANPANDNYDAGYEGVTRIVTDGIKTLNGDILAISGASYVMLLSRTEKYRKNSAAEWGKQQIQSDLAILPADYRELLDGQKATHGEIFNRLRLNLNAPAEDRLLSNEQLIAKQKTASDPVLALYERLFESGRYHYLCSSYEKGAPDLLGMWTGNINVGWQGFYHLDANLNLQISGGNIGAMPEAMEGYFYLMEAWREDFKINAQKLLKTRGMLGGGNGPGDASGLISSIANRYYPYHYVTGEMGWLLYPFWEHYLITGDEKFLRERLFPLLVDMGEFYEDFLTTIDEEGKYIKGKYIFVVLISPEAAPPGSRVRRQDNSLVLNSTFDIAGAKFCLETLLKTCNILKISESAAYPINKWKGILDKLPPYMINSDGALAEWSWPGLGESYGHRHSSHLITVWPLREITPENDPSLYAAARETLRRKDRGNYEGAGHGILHAALNAANLHNPASVSSKLLRLVREDFYYTSLATAHYANKGTFCTDVVNSLPTIMMEMLVKSDEGVIELLPALPEAMKRGSIMGIKNRNRSTTEELTWDTERREISVTLKSDIDQSLTLIVRGGIESISITRGSGVQIASSPFGNIARTVALPAGVSIGIRITLPLQDISQQ